MSQENVEVIRDGWDAWIRGDLPRLFRHFDPNVVWDTSHFHDWPESIEVEDVRAAPDGRVVSLIVQREKGGAVALRWEMESAQIATLRNGKVTRVDNFETAPKPWKPPG